MINKNEQLVFYKKTLNQPKNNYINIYKFYE